MRAVDPHELKQWRTTTAGELREWAALMAAKAERAVAAADELEPDGRKRRRPAGRKRRVKPGETG